jgi:uncharacterized protein
MTTATEVLEPYVEQRTVLLTTFKRDGTGIGTPVSIAVDGDHAYIRTFHTAHKVKRLRNNPKVEVAPSTVRGRTTGDGFAAHARLLEGREARHAAKLLGGKNKLLQGVLVPGAHRLMGYRTLHYELTPDVD